MECKAPFKKLYIIYNIIKVEPYWNVKIKTGYKVKEEKRIKVEPYWNVKKIYTLIKGLIEDIKVEPYWNVKV